MRSGGTDKKRLLSLKARSSQQLKTAGVKGKLRALKLGVGEKKSRADLAFEQMIMNLKPASSDDEPSVSEQKEECDEAASQKKQVPPNASSSDCIKTDRSLDNTVASKKSKEES